MLEEDGLPASVGAKGRTDRLRGMSGGRTPARRQAGACARIGERVLRRGGAVLPAVAGC